MANGNLTTKEYVIKMSQKLDDFIDSCKDDKEDHRSEHKVMWKLIIGIPGLLVVLFTLVKLLGG